MRLASASGSAVHGLERATGATACESRIACTPPDLFLSTRRAYIYRPSRSQMQAGLAATSVIRLEFDPPLRGKWEGRPLGWTSGRDPLQGLSLRFGSVREAARYCEGMGWKAEVATGTEMDKKREPVIVPKQYADNFRYSPNKLKLIRTK